MMKSNYEISLTAAALMAAGSFASVHAATVTWDGSEANGTWSDGLNWDSGTVPAASDTVIINNGDTVNVDVTLAGGQNITVSNGSTLNNNSSSFANGATITFESGATIDSAEDKNWYLDGGANFVFEDGAIGAGAWLSIYTRSDFNGGLTFNLSETGFTKMDARRLMAWTDYTTDMPGTTFTVDMASYTGGVGTIALMDFGADTGLTDAQFQLSNLVVANAGGYTANLSFDEANDIIQLNVTAIPEPSVFALLSGALAFGCVMLRRRA